MYADDTTIYFNLEEFDSQNTEKDINAEVEKVNTWLKLNKKSINVQKTKFMVFHRKQKKSVRSIVAIDNTVVKRVQSFNFLGIMLNEALSWKIHIPMLPCADKTLYLMFRKLLRRAILVTSLISLHMLVIQRV